MALVLTLQLLMLLFATTGFAAPSSGCPSPSLTNDSPSFVNFQLQSVFLGIGQLSYNCTGSGSYDIVGIETELFDATCVNGGGYLAGVVETTVADIQENPDSGTSGWGGFIEEKFDFNTAGKFNSINSTSFEIDFGMSADGNGDTSVIVSITDNYGDSQGQQMVNEDESLLIGLELWVVATGGQSPSTCAAGSSGSVDAVVLLCVYETQDNQ